MVVIYSCLDFVVGFDLQVLWVRGFEFDWCVFVGFWFLLLCVACVSLLWRCVFECFVLGDFCLLFVVMLLYVLCG